ncbi:hypothetical protein HDU84_006444 [Entophlyctis sp. JEL0112]|nr:hypothetical protein HDU84_006444 [Entophlyctis sp. JEL0112]
MSCCPPTALPPAPAVGGESGSIQVHNNTTLFVVPPKNAPQGSAVGIVNVPDIYGFDSGRTKSNAERLGALGFAVAIVDVTKDGAWVKDDLSNFGAWLKENDLPSVVIPRVQSAVDFLKTSFGVSKIVLVGYCYGGWVGASFSVSPDPAVVGNVSFHPSWRLENMLKGDGAVEKLTEKITVPQLLLAAKDDPDFVRENGSVINILKSKPAPISALSSARNFDAVNHGWVNRGDLSKPEVKEAEEAAWSEALAFIHSIAPLQ